MLKLPLFVLVFLFISFQISAQQAKISGTITDIDGSAVDFVNVAVKNSALGVMSNFKGQYQIQVSQKDSVNLVFSRMGYQTSERKFPQVTGNITVNVTLAKKENIIEEVVVTGEKAQTTTTGKIEVGNMNQLADPSGGNIESIIATEPGVSKTNELSSQYSVRGGNYDENMVYINGIEVYRPLLIRSGQQEGLSAINPNMTQEVKFSTGGFEASYGDKMSSVLDITYKKPKAFEAAVTGSLLGANAYIGSSSGRFTQVTGIRYKTTKSLLSTMDTDAEYNPSFTDIQSYMTLALSPKWDVSFLGNVSNNIFKFSPKSRTTKFGTLADAKNFYVAFDGWEHDKFLTYFGALTLKGKLTENLEIGLTGSAFSSQERESYDIAGEYRLTDANLATQGNEGDNGSLLGVGSYMLHARNKLDATVSNLSHFGSYKFNKHNIKWGAILQQEKIDNKIKEWELRDSAGYSMPNTPDLVTVFSNLKANSTTNTTRYSGYLQDTYLFTSGDDVIYINAGIRGSYWSFNKEFIFSPRVSVAYIPNNRNLTLRFATGIYYQAPFYKEYLKTVTENHNSEMVLNKDIKSQKSIQFVLSGDYKFSAMDRPFKFTSAIYYKKMTNLIPYMVDNVKIRYLGENEGSGYTTGIDFKLFGQFIEKTDNWISLSFMKTQQNVFGQKVPLPTDQAYNLSAFFQDYIPGSKRLTMNIRGHLSQGLPHASPNSGYFNKGYFRAPAYRRIDVGFAWELLGEDYAIRNRSGFCRSFKSIWLGADIFNLFDIQNTNSYYWVSDIFNRQSPVPNYLTSRQFNLKIVAEF